MEFGVLGSPSGSVAAGSFHPNACAPSVSTRTVVDGPTLRCTPAVAVPVQL